MKRKYAEQFLSEGKLRIGSLYDFRNIEKYGEETGDEGEGTKELYTEQKHVHENNIPDFLKGAIKVGGGSKIDIIIDGDNTIDRKFEDPNLYIYCVSLDFNEDRMRKIGHDACLVIEDQSFFQHMHNAMKTKIAPNTQGVLSSVYYGSRRYLHTRDPNIPMAVIKPERFRYQNEARAIWIPDPEKEIEEFFYINVPMAVLSCRRSLVLIDR